MHSNAQNTHELLPRTINVNGKAEIKAEPDRALIPMSVEIRAKNLESAKTQVDETVSNILNFCKELNIDKKHVKTAQIISRPEYNWKSKKRELIGYYVSRRIEIDLQDLNQLGQLMHGVSELGINNTTSPQFYSSRKDEIYREALASASKNAKENALVLAKALDTKLGAVHQINATNVHYNRPQVANTRMRTMTTESKKTPQETYQAGEISVTADVNVVFDIK